MLAEADRLIAALENRDKPALPVSRSPRGQGQLFHRAQAALRLPPLPCGCHDPALYLHRKGYCCDAA